MAKKALKNKPCCCPPKPLLNERPLISPAEAVELTGLFKVLANDTRLRLLHALVIADELCVSELASEIGMKTQAVSNQLQLLTSLGFISSRRNGNQVYYRIVDSCIFDLLDKGLCLNEDSKERKP